ncbi:MAG: histidinol-phosphatase [Erysipelotrichaceae bacterium]|nr:histidinol-phosphatase [Erysipelotrichaceae bacterium]
MDKVKITTCFHTHTARCGHAQGSDEQYVVSAIENEIETLGFSDHIMLPNISEPGMRGEFHELEDYLISINELKQKYADQIKIHVGFEAEFDEQFVGYYKKLLEEGKIEYLILGQHSYYDPKLKRMVFYSNWASVDQRPAFKAYTDRVIEAMESGLFAYVCHPDLMMQVYPEFDSFAKKESERIIDAAIKYDIPLELNLGGIRTGKRFGRTSNRYRYPVQEFWELVASKGAKVIIGIDAHAPKDFKYYRDFELLKEVVGHLKFNLVNEIELYSAKE